MTLTLTTKVDIYSFGVVILEAVCGRQPVLKDPKTINKDILIADWVWYQTFGNIYSHYGWKFEKFSKRFVIVQVRPSYERGVIEEVVDNRLENEYNVSSVWKVVEIAMACVKLEGIKRPTMYTICNDLDEALRIESNSEGSAMNTEEVSSIYSNVQARWGIMWLSRNI